MRRANALSYNEDVEQARAKTTLWWPGQPKPAAEPGELLVLVKQYGEPPPAIPGAGG